MELLHLNRRWRDAEFLAGDELPGVAALTDNDLRALNFVLNYQTLESK
jgi:hypothetical protein